MPSYLLLLCCIGVSLPIALFVFYALYIPVSPLPTLGERGEAKRKAMGFIFYRIFQWPLSIAAAHIARLPINKQRKKIDRALHYAGEMQGLNPDEFIVVSIVSTLFGIVTGLYFYHSIDSTLVFFTCTIMGPFLPALQLKSRKKQRFKAVDRGLPAAIDLAALCMSAGADFHAAFTLVVTNMNHKKNYVRKELERVLQELSLGHSRKQALEVLAHRVPSVSVREFVGALIQAEEKGTPIASILQTQADSMRNKRSVLAEEAAARAGVMFMLPMMMVMASILLILVGPLILEMRKGGF